MGELIIFVSSKGGAGNSTLAVHTSKELAKEKRVLLIDSSFNFRNVDLLLNLENSIVYDLYDISNRNTDPGKAVVDMKDNENLSFLSASASKDFSQIDEESLRNIVMKFKEAFDYIIVDVPMDMKTIKFWLGISQRVILVALNNLLSMRTLEKYLWDIKKINRDLKIAIVFNMVETNKLLNYSEDASFENYPGVYCVYKLPFLESSGLLHDLHEDYIFDLGNIARGEAVVSPDFQSRGKKLSFWERLIGGGINGQTKN